MALPFDVLGLTRHFRSAADVTHHYREYLDLVRDIAIRKRRLVVVRSEPSDHTSGWGRRDSLDTALPASADEIDYLEKAARQCFLDGHDMYRDWRHFAGASGKGTSVRSTTGRTWGGVVLLGVCLVKLVLAFTNVITVPTALSQQGSTVETIVDAVQYAAGYDDAAGNGTPPGDANVLQASEGSVDLKSLVPVISLSIIFFMSFRGLSWTCTTYGDSFVITAPSLAHLWSSLWHGSLLRFPWAP